MYRPWNISSRKWRNEQISRWRAPDTLQKVGAYREKDRWSYFDRSCEIFLNRLPMGFRFGLWRPWKKAGFMGDWSQLADFTPLVHQSKDKTTAAAIATRPLMHTEQCQQSFLYVHLIWFLLKMMHNNFASIWQKGKGFFQPWVYNICKSKSHFGPKKLNKAHQ